MNRALARLYDQHLRAIAARYSNMGPGRANSAAYVAQYFHEVVDLVGPSLFVEVGAYRAEASRRVRSSHPDARVVALEANPYNFERYADGLDFEYLNLAATDTEGWVTFHLRRRQGGEDLRKVTGNSSLLRRTDTDVEYDEVSVPGITLDALFPDAGETACLWIDVEGASAQVLRGGAELLRRTSVVLIEVEEKAIWEGQWRALDVTEFFIDAGFVPVTRDIEYEQQHNVVFVREDVYERPDVLMSLELHLNFQAQHMGV